MATLSSIKGKLQGQTFTGEVFENMDLRSMSSYGSKWESCIFRNCKLSLADMSTSKILDCKFEDCQMLATVFTRTEIRRTVFNGCEMDQAMFVGAVIEDSEFNRCRLHLSTFHQATIRKVTFWRTNFHGADLRYIECHGAHYEDVVLWGAAISLGCQFFNATFDERSTDLFTALIGKVHPDLRKRNLLKEMAGDGTKVIERLMA